MLLLSGMKQKCAREKPAVVGTISLEQKKVSAWDSEILLKNMHHGSTKLK